MIEDLKYLWTFRQRPNGWRSWIRCWGKRLFTFVPLLRIFVDKWRIKRAGGRVGRMSVIGKSKIMGDLKRLSIGKGASVGRCEFALHDQVRIGDYAVVNDGVIILTASHDLSDPHWGSTMRPVQIGAYAWIATNAILLPGVTIGRGSVVAAGAVVRADVPDYSVVFGNPATISDKRRSVNLEYCPAFLNAPIAAWLGSRRRI